MRNKIRTRESFEALRTRILDENEARRANLAHEMTLAHLEQKLWAKLTYEDYREATEHV